MENKLLGGRSTFVKPDEIHEKLKSSLKKLSEGLINLIECPLPPSERM
jgi:hypothetical protein